MSINHLATVLVLLAFIPSSLFAVLYPVLTRGKFTQTRGGTGWLVFGLGLEVALFLGFALTVRLFGRYPGYEIVAVLLYGGLVGLTWWLLLSMLAANRRR